MTNRYGMKFEVGKIYMACGPIKFGNNGNGFHMCKNMEDTFRYFDSTNIAVCKVNGFGKKKLYEDEYYGFYDMYTRSKMTYDFLYATLNFMYAYSIKDKQEGIRNYI